MPAAEPPIELPARPKGPIDRVIADHVARLIPDRATIELGLGAIPQAVTRALGRKQGLGVHSGAIGDGIADLMEAGIVDNQRTGWSPRWKRHSRRVASRLAPRIISNRPFPRSREPFRFTRNRGVVDSSRKRPFLDCWSADGS